MRETIEAGLKLRAVKVSQFALVNVDTMIQEKNIRFPTDARFYDRAGERLVKAAKERNIPLRQNYNRKIGRAKGCMGKLKIFLGRVMRDIKGNIRSRMSNCVHYCHGN